MNLKIREFKQSIINFVNASDLPVEVKFLVLADISNQTGIMANEQIKKEIAERNKKESEVNKDELHESP